MATQKTNFPATTTTAEDDYSPESTLIPFPKPIPLLRGPIPAGPNDDPELGPYVLGFPSPRSFLTALTTTRSKLLEQCEAGTRFGCSISASNKCMTPWWKIAVLGQKVDLKDRAECEEREMQACLVGSTEKCANFVEEKCLVPFGSARVRKVREVKKSDLSPLADWASKIGLLGFSGCELGSGSGSGDDDCEVGYVRGSEILRRRSESSF